MRFIPAGIWPAEPQPLALLPPLLWAPAPSLPEPPAAHIPPVPGMAPCRGPGAVPRGCCVPVPASPGQSEAKAEPRASSQRGHSTPAQPPQNSSLVPSCSAARATAPREGARWGLGTEQGTASDIAAEEHRAPGGAARCHGGAAHGGAMLPALGQPQAQPSGRAPHPCPCPHPLWHPAPCSPPLPTASPCPRGSLFWEGGSWHRL